MAEVLPTSFHRRWTADAPQRRRSGLFSRRLRVALVLASFTLVLAGASAGLFAWWQPLSKPALILLTSAPEGTVSVERSLAIQADGAALAGIILPKSHLLVNDATPTRAELLHYVNMLRLARAHDHLLLLVSSSAGLSSANEVVLYTSDAGPGDADNAIRLCDLLDAIGQCRSDGTLVLLDLVPANDALLKVVPPADLAACIDATLSKADLGSAAVLTSYSPGEQSQLLAAGNRTVFGWLTAKALWGAADGAANTLPDGRVSSTELQSYLQQQLPAYSQRVDGQPQRPRLYGETCTFDLAVDTKHSPSLNCAAKYPPWLEAEWTRFAAARDGVEPDLADRWARKLQQVELLALAAHSDEQTKALQRQLAEFASPGGGPAQSPQLVSALEEFLAARRQTIESAPAGQAKAAEQKLLASFAKAQAAQTSTDLITACCQLAAMPNHADLDQWQALLAVIDARSNLPASSLLAHWRALYALRQQSATDATVAEAARYSLRTALTCEEVSNCHNTWPWLQSLADQMLDARVHGDALLFARGFAGAGDALQALRLADEQAQQLAQASTIISAHLQAREQNRRFAIEHTYLAAQEAGLTESWVQAVQALRRLEVLLAPPTRPWQSDIELRAWLGDLTSAAASVDSSLIALRNRFSGAEVANAIAACNQNDADAADLARARRLLASTEITPQQRSALWSAYLPKALQLQSADNTLVQPAGTTTDVAALAERRTTMFHAWQQYEQVLTDHRRDLPPDHAVLASAQALWWRDWQRFHQEEITRVTSPGEPPVWSSTSLDILGPFACETLRPDHPVTNFEMAWHQRHASDRPPVVTALSPSAALVVDVQPTRGQGAESARFRLRLHDTPSDKFAGAGFLAIFASGGRRYHALVELPAATDSAEVDIMLSTSATQLVPLDRIALMGNETTVYAWLENNTSAAQQVSLRWEGTAPSPPIPLAAHEVRCIPLAPPTATTPVTGLTLQVQDIATQRELARRTFELVSPTAADVIQVNSARVTWDPSRGAVLQVEVAATDDVHTTMGVTLTPLSKSAKGPLTVSAGTTRIPLSAAGQRGQLSAIFPPLRAGEQLRCAVAIEGLSEPLLLAGTFPAAGESANLFPVTTAQLSISGAAIAQPLANYPLTVTTANTSTDSQLRLTLHSSSDPTVVLSRQVPAQLPPAATVSASTPPGGLLLHPVVVPQSQTVNTSGLAGRFVWHAELISAGTISATTEQEVVFDNTPPAACRFVNPPGLASKSGVLSLQVTGWDDLTDIADVQLFIGQPKDGQAPPGVRLFAAKRLAGDAAIWSADVTTPAELGPCSISAVLTNAAGLSTVMTTQVQIVDALPPGQGEVDGVVVEGTLAQAGLEVTLEKSPGAALMTTKTDAGGKFHFTNVPVGSYTVRSTKVTSQRQGTAAVTVEAGAKASATIRLAL